MSPAYAKKLARFKKAEALIRAGRGVVSSCKAAGMSERTYRKMLDNPATKARKVVEGQRLVANRKFKPVVSLPLDSSGMISMTPKGFAIFCRTLVGGGDA